MQSSSTLYQYKQDIENNLDVNRGEGIKITLNNMTTGLE